VSLASCFISFQCISTKPAITNIIMAMMGLSKEAKIQKSPGKGAVEISGQDYPGY
jgi:hypothetical protein